MGSVRELTVSQLNGYIKSVFDDELILHNINVSGEIGQISVRDGVSYFSLTEGNCNINCVIFSTLEQIDVGTKVLVGGRVAFYAKNGRVNFTANFVKTIGQGEKFNEFTLLKERLSKEGLFDNRPKPPVYIREVAVITSEAGAVIHDIMSVIRSKNLNVGVKLYPASVQGDSAENSILSALKKVNVDCSDVVIIARGGGANYDLDVFNSEKLARAVAGSEVPVISAVGHEIDYTLCDFCAGLRCGTPSIAAEAISDINLNFLARFYTALQKISIETERLYSDKLAKTYRAAISIVHAIDKKVGMDWQRIIATEKRLYNAICLLSARDERNVFDLAEKMTNSLNNLYEQTQTRLKTAATLLDYSSPLKIISKGFAKVTVGNKDAVSASDLKVADNVKLIFADGYAEAKITKVR